jgi:protein-S-isoprenylcysteine O-methyltransferase Ste14
MTAHDLHLLAGDLWQIAGFDSGRMIRVMWMIFGLYWLVSALKRKKTKQRESWGQRLVYAVPLALGLWFLFRPEAHFGVLATRFLPDTATAQIAGVLLTAAGVGFACWARYHLGTNWSGTVTLKQGHELVRTGPYRLIRHPIYTGILLALLGTAVAVGEMRGLIAAAIALGAFFIKANREESFLAKEFGPSFAEHQRETGMFLPRFT